MTRSFLALAFVTASLTLSAQLVSPPSPAGHTHNRAIGAWTALEGSGGGQVWDFSSLTPQQTFQQVFTDASASFYGKTFPFAEWELDEAGVKLYYQSMDSMTYHGGVQGDIIIQYSNPQTTLTYPLELGDAISDTFAASYEATGVTVNRSGTSQASCEATGSVALPGGLTFGEAYLVHVEESIVDSTVLGNFYLDQAGDYLFVPEWPMPIFGAITIVSEDQITGTAPQTTTLSLWTSSITLDVAAPETSSLAAYPNPVQSGQPLTIAAAHAPAALTVRDASGRIIARPQSAFRSAFTVVSTDGWAPGLYFIEGAGSTQRLLVQ